jgi:hypothetical protein
MATVQGSPVTETVRPYPGPAPSPYAAHNSLVEGEFSGGPGQGLDWRQWGHEPDASERLGLSRRTDPDDVAADSRWAGNIVQ